MVVEESADLAEAEVGFKGLGGFAPDGFEGVDGVVGAGMTSGGREGGGGTARLPF